MASEDTFKPGLFGTGLNIEKKLSNQYLFIESKILTHYLEIEPDYMKPAIRNLQAVLLFNMDSTRTDARWMLEDLIKHFPQDLNALADLSYVYKEMGRVQDCDEYKRKLDSCKDDELLRARSILGQANALTYDLPDDHNKSPSFLLKDTWRQLNMKDTYLERVKNANNLVVDAYKAVNTIPETAHEKKIKAKEKAVEKFEIGIQMLEKCNRPKEEILVWKHNLAIARNRLETWKNKRGDDTNSRSQNFIKVLEDHLDVIENLPQNKEPLKKYVAKSYSYFAQVYTEQKSLIDHTQLPDRIKSQIKDLDLMWQKAKQIYPDDQIVLQTHGRICINNDKNEEAIKVYNKSINFIPDKHINWFSYAGRRDAYYYFCRKERIKKQPAIDTIKQYLELAYQDGKSCLQSKSTADCMIKMAQICFFRSMPDNESGVSFQCEHKEFIYEALENIHEALKKRDTSKDGRIYSELGRFYPYIGEYRKAVEYLKTALELNNWSEKYPLPFSNLCRCFVAFYQRGKDENLLTEFRFMLKEAMKYKRDNWVDNAIDMVLQPNPEMLTHLVKNMIRWDVKDCKILIKKILEKLASPDLKQEFEEKLQESLQETSNQESNVNGNMEIQKLSSQEIFEYDFFVSHSDKDKDWVNSMLRPNLEEFDEDIRFKGCLPCRDFVPGQLKIGSIVDGIQKSRKLLIVLTPDYLKDAWQNYISDLMILDTIDSKINEKTIIPIMLKSCKIPCKISPFTSIAFIEESPWDQLRMSLTVKKDPEQSLEEKMSGLEIGSSDEH